MSLTLRSMAIAVLVCVATAAALSACGGSSKAPVEKSATIRGQVPYVLLPAPQGDVLVQVISTSAAGAEPTASVLTSTADSGRFAITVPPGTYVVRASYYDTALRSAPVTVAGGDLAVVRFPKH